MIKELVETYLASKDLKRVSGRDTDFAPLLPMLMMDAANTIWSETMKKAPSKQLMKKYKSEFERSYHLFMRDFFRCFNPTQADWLIDKMDEYEEYIAHDLFIARVQIMNCVDFEPLERQEVLAGAMLCNVLSQSAQLVYMRVFKNVRCLDKENPYLKKCEIYSYQWMSEYYGKGKRRVNVNEDSVACQAIDILCKKLITFLKKIEQDEISQS